MRATHSPSRVGAVGGEEARERGRDERGRGAQHRVLPLERELRQRGSRARARATNAERRRARANVVGRGEDRRRRPRRRASSARPAAASDRGAQRVATSRSTSADEQRAAGRGSSGRRWPGRSRPRGRRRRAWSWRRRPGRCRRARASRIRSAPCGAAGRSETVRADRLIVSTCHVTSAIARERLIVNCVPRHTLCSRSVSTIAPRRLTRQRRRPARARRRVLTAGERLDPGGCPGGRRPGGSGRSRDDAAEELDADEVAHLRRIVEVPAAGRVDQRQDAPGEVLGRPVEVDARRAAGPPRPPARGTGAGSRR